MRPRADFSAGGATSFFADICFILFGSERRRRRYITGAAPDTI